MLRLFELNGGWRIFCDPLQVPQYLNSNLRVPHLLSAAADKSAVFDFRLSTLNLQPPSKIDTRVPLTAAFPHAIVTWGIIEPWIGHALGLGNSRYSQNGTGLPLTMQQGLARRAP